MEQNHDILTSREVNNRTIEQFADESLIHDKKMERIENELEDAQSAGLYIMEKFGVSLQRQFGYLNCKSMLDAMLDPLGMMYVYRESAAESAKDRTEYILAFREDGKAVAITPTHFGYRWYTPCDSKSGWATKAYCEKLKPGCYVFTRPLEVKRSVTRTFLANVLHQLTIYDIRRIVFISLLASLFGLVLPGINRWIYNEYIKNADILRNQFVFAALLFLMVSAIRNVLSLLKNVAMTKIKIRTAMKMQAAIMAKVLHLPQSFFMENSSGRLAKRISNCGRLSNRMLDFFLDVLVDFGFSGFYLIQMRQFAPALYLPAVLFLLLRIVVSVISAIAYSYNEAESIEADMENSSFLYSSIRGIQKIKGMGAEKLLYAKWAEIYRKRLHADFQQPFFLKYQNVLITAVASVATVSLMGLASANQITREEYATFLSSYSLILTVVTSLTDMMRNLFGMRVLSENVQPVLRAANEQTETLKYVKNLKGDIRLDNVYYTYPDMMDPCLQGVSLHIRPGEKVAIVGESGCGKSTVLKLLIGFLRPDQGIIYYDNKPLWTLNLQSLRQNIGSVFQFSRLIPGTIASNVTFTTTREYNDEMIWDALDKAAIGDDIRRLPLGLETEISESNSTGFSGGQRQRILLARAFMSNPSVMILDEATSALDNITQRQVLDTIIKHPATVILIAHRLSTVVAFDRIVMMEGGKIAEQGTYTELMQKNGKFASLVQKQLVKA